MSQEDTQESRQPLHFFISYTSSDLPWAEWIAMQLEQAGYTVVIQAWDFRPGSNFVAEMDRAAKRAERTLLVLSPAYLRSDLAFSAWAAAFSQDPGGTQGRVLPVRIEPCDVPGLLRQVVSIDLVSLDEAQARERLLEGVKKGRAKPATAGFPGRHVPILPASAPFPGSLPPIWNIPFARNPFFTGQEHVLARLSEALHPGETDAHGYPRIALSGLGGIGKTQLAVEYAYRHRSAYDAILWVNANTTENLMRSYSELARLLKLPDCDAQEQERVVQAVKDWLRKERNYLLILDNADTPSFLRQFMPQDAGGHLLITTRVSTITEAGLGLAAPLALEALDPETGAQLLLRRANLLTTATPPDQELARLLSIELGGLPLALDQAGAYIASKPTSLARYQQLYQQHHLKLLSKRNNEIEHPEPVVTTWDISFRAVEETDPAAANLLRFCAFLAPSGIPEYILIAGTEGLAPMFADELLLDEAIGVLRSYSLIERDSESGMIHMHRLVQEVVRERMEEKEQVKWTARAMEAVLMVYPDDPDVANWPRQEQLLPHALQCALFAEVLNLAVVAVHLLNRMGKYLFSRARYEEAEPLLAHALAATEQGWEAEHAIRAACMNDLALLYVYQGRYEEAEPLYLRALALSEKEPGADHPSMAMGLNNLAALYIRQGRYDEAEQLCKQGMDLFEKELGPDHPSMAIGLNNLVEIYTFQGKYDEAEPLLERALTILENTLGADHPNTATSKSKLAEIYHHQGKQKEAELLMQQALAIREQKLGSDHPHTAIGLDNLATFYHHQGKDEEAEQLHLRALTICEKELGPDHPDTAICLNNLALFYESQKKYEKAEPLQLRALDIRERKLGTNHPQTVQSRQNLAGLYIGQEKYKEAEQLLERILAIQEQASGANHPQTADSLIILAYIYKCQERYEEAEPLYERALAIREQALGGNHPDTVTCRRTLIKLYMRQQRYEKAVSLAEQELVRCEKELGADHPKTAEGLTYLANLYMQQKRYEKAEPLYEQALAIREQKLGASHPDTMISVHNLVMIYTHQGKDEEAKPLLKRVLAIREQEQDLDLAESLNDLAVHYESLGSYREAESLYERALAIRERKLGADHPDTSASLNNLAGLYTHQRRYREAEPLMKQALAISEQKLGNNHRDTGVSLHNLAYLYIQQERCEEAEPLMRRALAICTETLSQDDPLTISVVKHYAFILEALRQKSQAAKSSQASLRSSHQREATRQKENG